MFCSSETASFHDRQQRVCVQFGDRTRIVNQAPTTTPQRDLRCYRPKQNLPRLRSQITIDYPTAPDTTKQAQPILLPTRRGRITIRFVTTQRFQRAQTPRQQKHPQPVHIQRCGHRHQPRLITIETLLNLDRASPTKPPDLLGTQLARQRRSRHMGHRPHQPGRLQPSPRRRTRHRRGIHQPRHRRPNPIKTPLARRIKRCAHHRPQPVQTRLHLRHRPHPPRHRRPVTRIRHNRQQHSQPGQQLRPPPHHIHPRIRQPALTRHTKTTPHGPTTSPQTISIEHTFDTNHNPNIKQPKPLKTHQYN